MLKRTSLLQIDSHSLPVPTGSPTIKFSDVESSDSGADEMGVYHREVLRFGVLTFLGAAALLTVPLRSLLDRIPPRLGLALSFLLFLVVRDMNSGFLGFAGVPVLHLPQSWYANTLTTALGFPYPGFVSSDYFSLLPWLLLFWTGYHLYRLRPETPALPDIRLPGLMAMGRHSLVIYLLHQPVIYGLLALIFS